MPAGWKYVWLASGEAGAVQVSRDRMGLQARSSRACKHAAWLAVAIAFASARPTLFFVLLGEEWRADGIVAEDGGAKAGAEEQQEPPVGAAKPHGHEGSAKGGDLCARHRDRANGTRYTPSERLVHWDGQGPGAWRERGGSVARGEGQMERHHIWVGDISGE